MKYSLSGVVFAYSWSLSGLVLDPIQICESIRVMGLSTGHSFPFLILLLYGFL